MRPLPSIPRVHTTMFALYIVPLQIIDIVNSINTDPDTVPNGRARLIEGDGRASGLECWHGAGSVMHGHLKAAFLITIFILISAFIIFTRWGSCWKTADHPGLKQQKSKLTAQCSGIQSNSTSADGPSNWTVSIPYSTTTRSDAFKAPMIPTSAKESLNRFPSNLTIGVYTGFTTGVGPRR